MFLAMRKCNFGEIIHNTVSITDNIPSNCTFFFDDIEYHYIGKERERERTIAFITNVIYSIKINM